MVHREIELACEFKAAIISKHQNTDPLCRQTMDIFIRCYGAGDLPPHLLNTPPQYPLSMHTLSQYTINISSQFPLNALY